MKKDLKTKYLNYRRKYLLSSIAQRIGITRTYLSKILNGRKPSEEVMNKLLKILDEQ